MRVEVLCVKCDQGASEVDLSQFGSGTYVIKFTDKEGMCYERVVVE